MATTTKLQLPDIARAVKHVPTNSIRSIFDSPSLTDVQISDACIPLIDLPDLHGPRHSDIIKQIAQACQQGGFFQEHRYLQSLYYNKARFFYLLTLLLLQSMRVEARGDGLDSYLITMGIVILIAVVILIVIASLCYCMNRFTGESILLLEAAVELEPVQTFQTIPVVPFQAGEYDDTCGICRGMYTDGEILRKLPNCPHRYHHPCIESWLTTRNTTCPSCRHDYRDQLVPNPFPV